MRGSLFIKESKKAEPEFFGVHLDDKWRYTVESKLNFCKILFLNPNISASKAREIINDPFYQIHAKAFAKIFHNEILETMVQVKKTQITEYEICRNFENKMIEWAKTFSFPLPDELLLLSKLYGIPIESIIELSVCAMTQPTMSKHSINKYLQNYSTHLNSEQIDHVLDNLNRLKKNSPDKKYFLKKIILFLKKYCQLYSIT